MKKHRLFYKWRAWKEAKKVHKLGKMVVKEIKGLKRSIEGKKGVTLHDSMIGIKVEKRRFPSL